MARNILKEADRIVNGARRKDYGTPKDNHTCTAEMVTAYLRRRGLLKLGAALTAEDVCFINILQKVSRCANVVTRDGLTDISGYARNVELIQEERKH